MIDPNWQPNWHHFEIAEHLEKVERGEIDRLMIFMPPRHGKSQLASVLFPAWCMGRSPNMKIIASSYAAELAQDFGYQVRNTINETQYQSLFQTKLKEDSQAKGNWRTDEGGHYLAVGAGGGITGRGADLLIIDDPVKNRDEANSSVYRDKIYRWYTSTAYTRLHAGGRIVVIQTRWHDDDLSGRLLRENPGEWTVLNLPALANTDEQYRKTGEALWPAMYPKEALLRIKQNIGEDWEPLYQQDPIGLQGGSFKKEWIKRYEELPKLLNVRIIIDLASSEDQRAAENAILVIGQSLDRKRYILESWGDWGDENRRFTPDELVEKCYEFGDKWSKEYGQMKMHPESVGYQSTLKYDFQRKARQRSQEGKRVFTLEELKTPTNKSKDDKIEALAGPLSHGMIFFPHGGTSELENQLLRFPKGERVDRLDTLAMDLDIERRPSNVRAQMPRTTYDPNTGRVLAVR